MRQPIFNPIEVPNRDHPTRKLAMGALPINGASKEDKRRAIVGFIKGVQQCPTYNLPVLDNVTIHYDGPLTDAQLTQTFGTVINPLGANPEAPPAGAVQVDTTFAEPGKFQTWNLICGIQWRLDFEPVALTVLGNGWTAPASGEAIPVSPDDFNVNAAHPDTATAGPLGLLSGETMVQAALEWAWWAEMAGYYMARGYNLQWQWGNRQLLLNDSLRYTAYTPGNAQEGTATNADLDVAFFVRRTNNYYRQQLAAAQIFLTADRARLGNQALGGNAGLSVFRPSRNYEFVGAAIGGVALRQYLKGNMEFRRLGAPLLLPPGVPIGLKAQQSNNDDSTLMRQYLSCTYGQQGSPVTGPAVITPDININLGASTAGTASVTGVEPSLDSPSVANSQQLNSQRLIFKGGSWKLTVAFKGFELTPDQAQLVQDVDVQRAIQSECGCTCGGGR